MIPTIVGPAGEAVTESIVCVEFIDELAKAAGGSAPSLLPGSPYDRANAKVAADNANKTVCSAYYQVLVRKDYNERREAFDKICNGLLEFTAGMKGDYWAGDHLGLVDCVILPHAHRLYAVEHYRGEEFAVPKTGEGGLWEQWNEYIDRARTNPTVKRTLPGHERYIKHVAKYADGNARSKVGNAVRRGGDAHSYDDVLDGDDGEAAKPVPQKRE